MANYAHIVDNESKRPIILNPQTPAGNPAEVQAGSVVFTVLNGDATVELTDNEKAPYIVSGANGVSQIEVTADADLGEGVTTISQVFDVVVIDPQATGFGLQSGDSVPK